MKVADRRLTIPPQLKVFMVSNTFSNNDTYFLFKSFPIDTHILPLEIYPGISLVSTPEAISRQKSEDPKACAIIEFIYPGLHLGIGICHTSLKIDATIPEDQKMKLFWGIIACFRLVKPLFIQTSGCFEHDDTAICFIKNPQRLDFRTNFGLSLDQYHIQPQGWITYNEDDVKMVKKILPHFMAYFGQKNSLRMGYNILTFLQASVYETLHYRSSIYSKLFALIDSLAGNPLIYAKPVSRRLGNFLKEVSLTNGINIETRLLSIAELHRYPEIHGHIKESITPPINTYSQAFKPFPDREDLTDLLDLAEIARLGLLKILLLQNESLEEYCNIPIPLTGKSPKEAKDSNQDRSNKADAFFNKDHRVLNTLTSWPNPYDLQL